MSTDGSGKRCPRDNNRPLNLYPALFQPEAQVNNGQASHRMLLPNVPIMQPYRQQFVQYQQETQQFVPDQPVQTSPQEKHPTSGHLNQHIAQLLISGQTFPQDHHLVSSQLGQISPNARYLMSSRLDETSPPAQHTMSSHPIQNSSHSQQFMSSQPNKVSPNAQYMMMSSRSDETSPNAQYLMSSRSDETSPNAQYLMSSRSDETSPNAQYLMSSRSDETSPNAQYSVSSRSDETSPPSQHMMSRQSDQISQNVQYLVSSRLHEISPPAQHMMSSPPDEISPHSGQLMSSQSDEISPHSGQLMSSQSDEMSPHSGQLMSSQSDEMSPHSGQLMSSQPNHMSLLAQQLMFRQPNQASLQLFRGGTSYPQNTPPFQQSAQRVTVNLDSPSFVLDQLCLLDSASAMLRPDLLATGESLIEQREYDLNMFSAAGNSSRHLSQNVFPNNLSAPKNFDAFLSEHGSPNLMLDSLLTTKNSCSTRNVTPPVITSASMGNHNFVLNPSSSCHDMPSTSQFYSLPLSSKDASLPGPSMIHTGQFPLKLERRDFNTAAEENSNVTEASLWQNQTSEHFSPNRFTTRREFLESSSSVPNVPLVNTNTGSTFLISPERRAPKRSYDQSSMETQHRRTSECSNSSAAASSGAVSSATASSGAVSSGLASLEETLAASTNSETNTSGEAAAADDSKDPTYLEKRRKNNESAKKSREARRLKEKTNFSAVLDYHQKISDSMTHLHVLREENRMLRQHLGILAGFDEQCTSRPGLYQFVPQPPTFDKQEHF